jgi:hypothetical protein
MAGADWMKRSAVDRLEVVVGSATAPGVTLTGHKQAGDRFVISSSAVEDHLTFQFATCPRTLAENFTFSGDC